MEDAIKISISDEQNALSGISIQPCILKLIHQYLLQNYPSKDVFEFWKNNMPASSNGPVEMKAFFDLILNSQKSLPLHYVMTVLDAFELFHVDRGEGSEDLGRKLCTYMVKTGAGNYGKMIHYVVSALKSNTFHQADMRQLILQLSDKSSKYLCRKLLSEVVKESKNTGLIKIVLLCALKTRGGLYSPPFDCDLWIGGKNKTAPIKFNLPEYEHVNIISDARAINDVVPGAIIVPENALSQMNAVRTKKYSFSLFLTSKGIAIKNLNDASLKKEVFEVLEDYYCPKKKRIILHKGCIYQAPVYLFEIIFAQSTGHNIMKALSYAVNIMEKEKKLEILTKSLHEEFLRQGDARCAFFYNKQTDTIALNGKHFIRSVPAKILRKRIQKYVEQGHDGGIEIERKWLLNDAEIVYDRTNPNLERRFELIAEAFKKKCPECCCFKRPKKGVIRFEPKGQVSFEER